MSRQLPERDRWERWVTFAWFLVVIAAIGGISIISVAGFIEVPRRNYLGEIETAKEPNIMIWAIAIGQTLSSALLAALFSIINSIYQNSCDQLTGETFQTPKAKKPSQNESKNMDVLADENDFAEHDGLKVKSVHPASQLEGLLHPGYTLLGINDQPATSEIEAAKAIVKGDNKITFINRRGEKRAHVINMKPGPLHIKFET